MSPLVAGPISPANKPQTPDALAEMIGWGVEPMQISRRRILLSLAAAAAATRRPASAQFVSGVLGANTAVTGYEMVQAIELIKRLGFPSIEIHTMGMPQARSGQFPGFELDQLNSTQRRRIRRALEGFEHVTSHLPYTDLHTFSSFPSVARFSRRQVEKAIEGSGYFGCELAVLHAEALEDERAASTWDERIGLYRKWGDLAAEHDVKIAIETGYPRSIREFVDMIHEIDHDNIGATLDVGHQKGYAELLAKVKPEERGTAKGRQAYNDANIELVEKLGPKLFHLHIHDIEPSTWAEHKPLEHGFVDYARLLAKLAEIHYKGILMFEIGGDPEKMPGYLADAKQKLEDSIAAL